ncbi:MAG: SIR2 family protein, partial [Anaerolineae bacterium]
MSNLIERLAQLVLQDNAIFFVGSQFTSGSDQPSYLDQIADRLAAHLQHAAPDEQLSAIAQQYQASAGRAALIQALKEALAELPDQTAPVYKLLADSIAPHTKIITTRFDQALETALNQARKSYIRIISDEEVSFFDESRISLIKIRGDISRADSLLITEDDIDDFFKRLPALNDVVRAFFATKTLIFLGYDLDDPAFRRFFREVTPRATEFRRPAYAIVPASPRSAGYWEQENIVIHAEPVNQFLNTLAETVQAASEQPVSGPINPLARLAEPPKPDEPYKSLDSFGRLDKAVFAGRRGAIERLAHRILAHPVTVLFGESGNGKTSLLQAGVSSRLAQNQSLLLMTAPIPGQSLADGWLADWSKMSDLIGWTGGPVENLTAALRANQARLNGPTVLVLDQFEQFFVTYSAGERDTAVTKLCDLLQNEQLNLRLVLVIREDFLGHLQTLETALPGLLDIRFRLGRLDEEAARNAIEHPARPFG